MKLFLALIFVLALVAGGVVAYEAFSESTRRTVELGRDFSGDVGQAIDQLQELIRNNTQ